MKYVENYIPKSTYENQTNIVNLIKALKQEMLADFVVQKTILTEIPSILLYKAELFIQ